jgi:hypothetical protein
MIYLHIVFLCTDPQLSVILKEGVVIMLIIHSKTHSQLWLTVCLMIQFYLFIFQQKQYRVKQNKLVQ